MSSDTARENASVVDSSVSDWKHDMGNSDDPDSSSYKAVGEGFPSSMQKLLHSPDADRSVKLYNTRYFIIKSLNHHNIQLSIERGIWATQVMNEPILEEAFHNSVRVILIFSVNMSGFFQGYAQMMSSVGWRRDNVWSQGGGKGNPWGRSFKVKWLCLSNLPFQKTLHLKNPLNDYKPVKISRDCQELPQDIGEALCDLLDTYVDGSLKSFNRDDLPSKHTFLEPSCSLGDEEYNMPPVHTTWAGMPMHCPPFLYHPQAGARRYHFIHPLSTGAAEYLSMSSEASKDGVMNNSCRKKNLISQPANHDMPTQYDSWGLSAESPHTSTLAEEDFLEMTYEEYLEAHSRAIKTLCPPVSASSQKMQQSTTRKHGDDSNSSSVTDRDHSRKRSHRSP